MTRRGERGGLGARSDVGAAEQVASLSLVLTPRVKRILNVVVALFYVVSIIASCIGEGWVYYILGSAVEVALLVAIVRAA